MDWTEFCDLIPEPKTITVAAYTGAGAYGEKHADPVDVSPCVVEQTRRRVTTQTQDAAGGIVISSTTVYCPPGTVAPVKSLVTIAGAESRVLAAYTLDDHGLNLPSHVELLLE